MGAGVWQHWQEATTKIAGFMFTCVMFQLFFPDFLRRYLETLKDKFVSYFFPSIQMISFHEYCGSKHKISEAYSLIESYLSSKSPTHSDRIISELIKKRESLVLNMDAREEIIDVFDGFVVKWFLKVILPTSTTISWHTNTTDKKCFELTFHSKDRKVVTSSYLDYVMSEGREIAVRNRQQGIYTNNPSSDYMMSEGREIPVRNRQQGIYTNNPSSDYVMSERREIAVRNRQQRIYTNNPSDKWWDYKKNMWSHAVLKQPTTFKSLGLDPKIKEEIIDDLQLRKLASVIPSKSIVVIEDIDCSLDISGRRGKKRENEIRDSDPIVRKLKEEEGQGGRKSKVTLSGILNFMDGLWSACAGERIVVVTTNDVGKLDPALIQRGRIDKHFELWYCEFEAFKVLAKNILDIDTHYLFEKIREGFVVSYLTPADVAESLMPKTLTRDVETCLQNLIRALKISKFGEKEDEVMRYSDYEDEINQKKRLSELGSGSFSIRKRKP
ncbi:hypothetical protein Vadar_019374 [Vaccinium darrowii]|uniref:Uncharacterized protein n=1 Tax=Vaccinium darrowii TaxID=229202 RepID=A0ACB7Y0M0_9ERIC|nr:hypothetical protein Vadar_019374 [Vaccinium darrowii]